MDVSVVANKPIEWLMNSNAQLSLSVTKEGSHIECELEVVSDVLS